MKHRLAYLLALLSIFGVFVAGLASLFFGRDIGLIVLLCCAGAAVALSAWAPWEK